MFLLWLELSRLDLISSNFPAMEFSSCCVFSVVNPLEFELPEVGTPSTSFPFTLLVSTLLEVPLSFGLLIDCFRFVGLFFFTEEGNLSLSLSCNFGLFTEFLNEELGTFTSALLRTKGFGERLLLMDVDF